MLCFVFLTRDADFGQKRWFFHMLRVMWYGMWYVCDMYVICVKRGCGWHFWNRTFQNTEMRAAPLKALLSCPGCLATRTVNTNFSPRLLGNRKNENLNAAWSTSNRIAPMCFQQNTRNHQTCTFILKPKAPDLLKQHNICSCLATRTVRTNF